VLDGMRWAARRAAGGGVRDHAVVFKWRLVSPSTNLMIIALPGTSPAKDRRRCAGRSMRPRNARAFRPAPTARTTSSWPPGSAGTAPASRSRASCSNVATTSSESSATRRSRPSPEPFVLRGKPEINR